MDITKEISQAIIPSLALPKSGCTGLSGNTLTLSLLAQAPPFAGLLYIILKNLSIYVG